MGEHPLEAMIHSMVMEVTVKVTALTVQDSMAVGYLTGVAYGARVYRYTME